MTDEIVDEAEEDAPAAPTKTEMTISRKWFARWVVVLILLFAVSTWRDFKHDEELAKERKERIAHEEAADQRERRDDKIEACEGRNDISRSVTVLFRALSLEEDGVIDEEELTFIALTQRTLPIIDCEKEFG